MNNEALSKIYEALDNFDFQSSNSPFLDEGVFPAILWCIYFTTFYFLNTSRRLLIGSAVAQW